MGNAQTAGAAAPAELIPSSCQDEPSALCAKSARDDPVFGNAVLWGASDSYMPSTGNVQPTSTAAPVPEYVFKVTGPAEGEDYKEWSDRLWEEDRAYYEKALRALTAQLQQQRQQEQMQEAATHTSPAGSTLTRRKAHGGEDQ